MLVFCRYLLHKTSEVFETSDVYTENRKNFTSAPEDFYSGKEVCIKGIVKEFKGKPQIFVIKEAEILVK